MLRGSDMFVLVGVALCIGCAVPKYGFEFPGEIDRVAGPVVIPACWQV
jgi:hypothetical protein